MGSSDLTHSLRFITLGTKGEQEYPKGKDLVQSHTEKVFFFSRMFTLNILSLNQSTNQEKDAICNQELKMQAR